MSNVVVPIETDPHQFVQALLPWFARGSLQEDDAAMVREHLLHCAACRAELGAERSLQAALADCAEERAADTEAALGRMRALMANNPPAPQPAQGKGRWMPWALGLQSAAIAALLLVVVARPALEPVAPYKGLSAAPTAPPRPEALVMFRPGAAEPAIRKALLAHRAVIVGGPTESGAYRLSLPGGAPALAALRAEPAVSLAESLDPVAQP